MFYLENDETRLPCQVLVDICTTTIRKFGLAMLLTGLISVRYGKQKLITYYECPPILHLEPNKIYFHKLRKSCPIGQKKDWFACWLNSKWRSPLSNYSHLTFEEYWSYSYDSSLGYDCLYSDFLGMKRFFCKEMRIFRTLSSRYVCKLEM